MVEWQNTIGRYYLDSDWVHSGKCLPLNIMHLKSQKQNCTSRKRSLGYRIGESNLDCSETKKNLGVVEDNHLKMSSYF